MALFLNAIERGSDVDCFVLESNVAKVLDALSGEMFGAVSGAVTVEISASVLEQAVIRY